MAGEKVPRRGLLARALRVKGGERSLGSSLGQPAGEPVSSVRARASAFARTGGNPTPSTSEAGRPEGGNPDSLLRRLADTSPLFNHMVSYKAGEDRRFESEIMASDRSRAGVLAVVFAAGAVAAFAALTLFARPIFVTFSAGIGRWWAAAIFAAYACYESLYRAGIRRFMLADLKFPRGPRFANALVEISFPTLILLFLFRSVAPPIALSLPPVFIYFIFIAISTLRLDPIVTAFTGLIAGGEYFAAVILTRTPENPAAAPLLDAVGNHAAKALIILLAGAVSGLVAREIRRRILKTLKAQDEQARVVQVFGSHVSPQVRDRLLSQPDRLPAEDRDLCVMFLDVRGFTRFAESHAPKEVMELLSRLFEFSVKAVGDQGGIVNKFLGDGFMAVFGAPADDPGARMHALAAATEISRVLKAKIESGELPQVRIGIGLHAGRALTGEIGSFSRKEYTVVGDVVNLASRIESLNKEYGTEILASAEVVLQADLEGLHVVPLGNVRIRGHEAAVSIYRVS